MYVAMHKLALFDIFGRQYYFCTRSINYIQITPYISPMDQDIIYFAHSVDKNGNKH
jgi:hypothetical protein